MGVLFMKEITLEACGLVDGVKYFTQILDCSHQKGNVVRNLMTSMMNKYRPS